MIWNNSHKNTFSDVLPTYKTATRFVDGYGTAIDIEEYANSLWYDTAVDLALLTPLLPLLIEKNAPFAWIVST